MSNEFTAFTDAVTHGVTHARKPEVATLSKVAVLGGGPDACLLAAMCLAEEAQVTLFSAYGAELKQMRESAGISLRGTGPVGTYQFNRENAPSIQTTAELDTAISDAELIFLTGPIHKQRTYAMVLASHVRSGQIIVLAPGRSLGAVETAWHLRIGGCTEDVTIVETQGLPYWFDVQGMQLTLSHAAPVTAATLPSGRSHVLQQVKRFLPNIEPVESVLSSGFADGSALVEFPALLLNGPAIASGAVNIPMGAKPLPENNTFAALLGPEQLSVVAALAKERHNVAKAFGVRNLPTTDEWVQTYAGNQRGEGSRPVPNQTMSKTLLRDGVIGSLVPLLSAAEMSGVSTPITQSMVTLASVVLGADVAAAGRRLDTIGINASDLGTARRVMDSIAVGTN